MTLFLPPKNWKFYFISFCLLTSSLGIAEEKSLSILTLDDVIKEALRVSPEIEKSRIDLYLQQLREPGLIAELDPQFLANYSYTDDQSPRAVPAFEGSQSKRESFQIGINQKTLLGTEAKLLWDNHKLRNPSTFRILDPSAESILSLSIRQPLLRYFWGRPDKARRKTYRSGVSAAEERLQQRENDLAAAVARSYLVVNFNQERINVSKSALDDANRLLATYKEKKRYGLIEDSDLKQAEVTVELHETDLSLAKSDFERMKLELFEYLQRNNQIPSETSFATTLSTSAISTPQDLTEALRLGFNNRNDLKSLKWEMESAEWAYRSERLDTLPDLGLTGSYGVAGLDATYSNAWDDLGSFDHPVKSVGMDLLMPFGFKRESIQRKSKKLEWELSQRNFVQYEQKVSKEIQDAWENFVFQSEKLKKRQKLLDLQGQKLKSEQKNFDRGRSTTDLVVRFLQDLHQAQLEFIRAQVDLVLAQVELQRSVGLWGQRWSKR